jgi:hypothetical protein
VYVFFAGHGLASQGAVENRAARRAGGPPRRCRQAAELTAVGYPLFAKYAIQDRRVVRVICSR